MKKTTWTSKDGIIQAEWSEGMAKLLVNTPNNCFDTHHYVRQWFKEGRNSYRFPTFEDFDYAMTHYIARYDDLISDLKSESVITKPVAGRERVGNDPES